jgi:hypothetical protein
MIRSRFGGAALWMFASTAMVGGLLFGCDQVYADPVTTPFFSPFSGIPDSGLTSTRIPPVACRSVPEENAPCSRVGAICESGKSPDKMCNAVFVCADDRTYGSYWTEESPGGCSETCPDRSLIVEGAPCDIDGGTEAELHCTTPLGTCACTTGRDGAHAHARMWVCVKPADTTCPPDMPLLGAPCFGQRVCDYGSCAFKRGFRMICEDDVWQTEGAPCAD